MDASIAGPIAGSGSRKVWIDKADGRKRPLGISHLEDKIAQAAVVAVLNPIWEEDFLGISYGFRPGRKQHDALDALYVGITSKGQLRSGLETSGRFSTKSNTLRWKSSLRIG